MAPKSYPSNRIYPRWIRPAAGDSDLA